MLYIMSKIVWLILVYFRYAFLPFSSGDGPVMVLFDVKEESVF